VTLSGTMISLDGTGCRETGARTTTVTVVPAGTIVFGSGFWSTTTTLFGSPGASPLTCSRSFALAATFCASESSRFRKSGTCTWGAGTYTPRELDGDAVSATAGSPASRKQEERSKSRSIRDEGLGGAREG